MKKKIMIGLFLAVVCLALVGCGTKKTNETGIEEKDTVQLYSDATRIVYNFNDIYYITYYHDGEVLSGMEYTYKFSSSALASSDFPKIKSSYEEESSIKKVEQRENYVIITFNKEAYEKNTLTDIKQMYSNLVEVSKPE